MFVCLCLCLPLCVEIVTVSWQSIKSAEENEKINRHFCLKQSGCSLKCHVCGEDIKITQINKNNNTDEINNSNGKCKDFIRCLTHKRMWFKKKITLAN